MKRRKETKKSYANIFPSLDMIRTIRKFNFSRWLACGVSEQIASTLIPTTPIIMFCNPNKEVKVINFNMCKNKYSR